MLDLTGRLINNRYHVVAFIGRGGMAEVYQVWDQKRASHLAMKVLREDLAEDKIFLRRFRREAQTLEKLQHPNIVRFYGLEREGDLAFMLMDFVEGTTLRKVIFRAEGPLALAQVLEVARPVCSALHYAHQLGLVHCDLKPANVMIHHNGPVLVTDFGIARMTDAATVTMVGFGTPAYMTPEQVRGENPTPQTDIYAVGVVLFEMLTGGERPFIGEQAPITGTTGEKVRWEHLNLAPPSPRRFNPSLSPQLESLILGCLAKNPRDRYRSSLELLSALEAAIVKHESPPVAPVPEPDRVLSTPPPAPQHQSISPIGLKPGKVSPIIPKRYRIFAIAGGVLLMLVCLIAVAVGISSLLDGGAFSDTPIIAVTMDTSHTVTAADTPTFTLSPPKVDLSMGSVQLLDIQGDVRYETPADSPVTAEGGETIPAAGGTRIFTAAGSQVKLELSDGSTVFLGENTSIELTSIADEPDAFTTLTQVRGILLVDSDNLMVLANQRAFQAQATGTLMGVHYEPINGSFMVDCLEGTCLVGESLQLTSGQRAGYEEGILSVKVRESDYDLWSALGWELVPTPTIIPTMTTTPTLTETLTPTATPFPPDLQEEGPGRPGGGGDDGDSGGGDPPEKF